MKNTSLFLRKSNKKAKIYILTLGCPKNEVLSEKFAYKFKEIGFSIVDQIQKADYIFVNSCGFIESALEETINTIIELNSIKASNQKIILGGCAVQLYKEVFKKELFEADYVLNYNDLINLFNGDFEIPERYKLFNNSYTYLRISEGCSRKCSFCVIPKIKGSFRKFNYKDLLIEAENLRNKGFKELILVSQDTLSFGLSQLFNLIKEISHIGFKWIRLMYLNIDSFDEKVFKIFDLPSVIPYFEIPVQHLSQNVLKLMNRKSNFDKISKVVNMIRNYNNKSFIRTSIIVGHPGETESDFEFLLNKLEELNIDYIGIFPYSDMEFSDSYNYKDKVPDKKIIERYNLLIEKIEVLAEKRFSSLIGDEYEFIVDKISSSKNEVEIIGRTYFQAPEIDGITTVTKEKKLMKKLNVKPGDIKKIKIIGNTFYDLDAEIIN